jgi:hypothetical protein
VRLITISLNSGKVRRCCFARLDELLTDLSRCLRTTAELNWAIAEVCSPIMPFVEELILDATGISVTTRGAYRADRYGFVSDTPRFLRLNLVMDRTSKIFPVSLCHAGERRKNW